MTLGQQPPDEEPPKVSGGEDRVRAEVLEERPDRNPLRGLIAIVGCVIVWYIGLAICVVLTKLSWRVIQGAWELIP